MVPEDVRKLNISLGRFLTIFKDCFRSTPTYQHLKTYVKGQCSDLTSKTVKDLAKQRDTEGRTLQMFLETLKWDHRQAVRTLQDYVGRKHDGDETIGVLDFTYFTKQGNKTAGAKRQYNGEKGKKGNCVVSCHLAYVAGGFSTLLDGEVYLPEEWIADNQKRKEAGIPDSVEYRSRAEMAVQQVKRANKRVSMDWISFDAEFGQSPECLQGLEDANQPYVGEIPARASGWNHQPVVIDDPEDWSRPGPDPDFPVVHLEDRTARWVKDLLQEDPSMTQQEWTPYQVKQTTRGPELWEIKTTWIDHKRNGLPSDPRLLIVARHPFTNEVKYFLAYHPTGADRSTLLRVGFTRPEVERCFREIKQQIGMGDFEVRNYQPIQRHLVVSLISHLFVAEQTDRLQQSYPHLTKPQVKRAVNAMLQARRMTPQRRQAYLRKVCESIRETQQLNQRSYRSHRTRRRNTLKEAGYDLEKIPTCRKKAA